MQKPETPENEQSRLETLRSLNVLDTPPEERFDRLTRMAKKLFDVPIALVSLIDENRQWFKSCIGLDANETSRDISFCGHAILSGELFIIPNALEDERFADNPLVVNEPYIRFYAGCTIKAGNGQKLGTLCIIDDKPHNLTKEDLESLVDLTSLVERELAAIHLATEDDLTKITNRRGFMQLGQHSVNLCIRQKNPASLIFIDLDNFKTINDNFGHAEGDLALTVFAKILQDTCRSSDIVARLSGDEFVVMVTNGEKEIAEGLVERLNQSLMKANKKNNRGYNIAFSHGIVEFSSEKHSSIEDLLADGDRLMYQNKQH